VVKNPRPSRAGEFQVPDSSARAFRNAKGEVFLLAGSSLDIAMVGNSLNNVKRVSCKPLLQPVRSSDPSTYRNHEWMRSVYSIDGRNMLMLIHNEYHGWEYSQQCPKPSASKDYLNCWYGSVTFAQSSDGGRTFTRKPAPANIVATLPYRYVPNMGRVGPHGPSNIIKKPTDKYYYVMVQVDGYKAQKRGMCLLRGENFDPSTWRAWDGNGFNVRFIDPYTAKNIKPENHVCEPVAPEAFTSVTYNTYIKKYIAIGQKIVGNRDNSFAFYRLSDDLVRWSEPQKLFQTTTIGNWHTGDPAPTAYYSALDPNSPSANFDLTGQKMYLYFVRWRVNNKRFINRERDLLRVPIEFSQSE
jgi:hypothetical protein